MNTRHLRWIAILVPLAALLLLELARARLYPQFWSTPAGNALHVMLLVAGVVLFSTLLFREIERLQRTVEAQASQVQTLYQEASQQAQRLRALHEADLALTSELALDKVLPRVISLSRELTGARYGALGVIGEDGRLNQFITSGLDPHQRGAIGPLPKGLGLLGYLMHKGEPIRVDDIAAHPESVGFPPNHPPMMTLLGIPLLYRGELLGDLYLTEKAGDVPFDERDEELLVLFGAQAAAALANARLAQQVEGLAVLEERQRFAMDLHDGTIQSIFAIGLTLEALSHEGLDDPAQLRAQLRGSVEGLDEVIRDIRRYIVNLRPGRFGGRSLSAGISDLAREMRGRGLVQVRTAMEEGVDESLHAEQVGELLQVVREALTNAIKHARATVVVVEAEMNDDLDTLLLRIRDDGAGFKRPERGFPEGHQGLRNMARRIEGLGGTLAIRSAPGQGTSLDIALPVAEGTTL